MARVLVTGASGLAGSRIVVRLRGSHEVHGTFRAVRPDFLGHKEDLLRAVDVADAPAFLAALDAVAPEVVVHCAAMTNVDACEGAPEEARRVNVAPVKELARWAARQGARVVLMSTDYVFDGLSPPYEVDAQPRPLCVYSATKVEAEEAVREVPGSLIARSAVIYGRDFGHQKRNFATWLIGELRARRRVRVVDDQWNTPTLSEALADSLYAAIGRRVEGVVHVAGAECVSRYEFARRIARRFSLDTSLITPTATAELRQPARRPPKPCLSVSRTEALLGVRAPTLDEALGVLHGQLAASGADSLQPWW